MHNPSLFKTFVAAAAISLSRIVLQTSDTGATQAGADNAAHLPFGISDRAAGVAEGARVDVIVTGIAQVEYGGNVDPGDPLTSDAQGRAIKAEPAPGEQVACIGYATVSGEEDVFGAVRISPFILTGV